MERSDVSDIQENCPCYNCICLGICKHQPAYHLLDCEILYNYFNEGKLSVNTLTNRIVRMNRTLKRDFRLLTANEENYFMQDDNSWARINKYRYRVRKGAKNNA